MDGQIRCARLPTNFNTEGHVVDVGQMVALKYGVVGAME
jgi:hypothetical protein